MVPSTSEDYDHHQFPANFTEYIDLRPGKPLAEAEWTGNVCSREFEYINVSVDIEDDTTASIEFK